MLKEVMLSKKMKESKNYTNNKTRERKHNGGIKVLKKLLINRILHHLHSKSLLHHNQFGFSPQKSTIDATIAVKAFVEEGIHEGKITILVRLNCLGSF